jgi:SAM-dependent methyltransferase
MDYSKVRVSQDAQDGDYKEFFGGGATGWDQRGRFQLEFLKSRGVTEAHSLADVGCGPLRAGYHLIRYLNVGNYCGIDYNADFIRIAREAIVRDASLSSKAPRVQIIDDFGFAKLGSKFDIVLAFSVLNHVPQAGRAMFFRNLPELMNSQTRVFISHATWLSARSVPHGIVVTTTTCLKDHLHPSRWGWPTSESIFPIVELRAAG